MLQTRMRRVGGGANAPTAAALRRCSTNAAVRCSAVRSTAAHADSSSSSMSSSTSSSSTSASSNNAASSFSATGVVRAAAAAALAACVVVAAPAIALADEGGDDFELPFSAPVVTTESSPQAVALAKRLKREGARLYRAFWCSHCFNQEQAFGAEAMKEGFDVECFPDGWRRGVAMSTSCAAVPVRAFPTWVFPSGAVVEGEMDLDAIEAALDAPAQPMQLPAAQP